MGDSSWRLWLPILGVLITGLFTVVVAVINRQNKPVRDILKKTKIEGDGSLIEAIAVLNKQRENDQRLFETERAYYRRELVTARTEARESREYSAKLEGQIEMLKVQLDELKATTSRHIEYLRDRLEEHDIELHPKS